MSDRNKMTILLTLLVSFLCYSFYLYQPGLDARHVPGKMADKGKRLWQEKNCNSCHQVYGLGGYLGPDLTNIYAVRTEAHIRAFLRSGTNIMPDFKLNDAQIAQLIAYLKSMDSTGVAAPHQLKVNHDGTIER